MKQDSYVTLNNPVKFEGKKFTVFNYEDCTERKFVPWQVKEASIRGGVYLLTIYMAEMLFTMGPLYSAANLLVAGNYTYQVWKHMANAVTKVELLDDGKNVNFHFGRFDGSVKTVAIRDIKKLEHEKSLVETWEEQCLFPLQVGDKVYYLNGQGHEAVKHGEALRAIINGSSIKL